MIMLVVAAVLAVSGTAAAADQNVTITKAGFLPTSVTLAAGEKVTFTNTDTAAHQVVFNKTTGISCTPANLVLQATQTAVCTFASAGTFQYTDAQDKKLKGTVVVQAAPASVSVAVSPALVTFGSSVTLTGSVSSKAANEKVAIEGQACGENAARVVTNVTTTSGGAYSAGVQPLKNTSYTVRWKSSASPAVAVRVRPAVALGKLAAHRYAVRVRAGDSLAGKAVVLQRYDRSRSSWLRVKTALLAAGPSAAAPTVISSVTVSARVRARTQLRAVLPAAQAAPCYAAGTSNRISG
jgi:plastocyanin